MGTPKILFTEVIRKSIIAFVFILCTNFTNSESIPFYIVTSAKLNDTEISSKIFFSSLNSAIEDALQNNSTNFTKNFTIYLSGTDTYQTVGTPEGNINIINAKWDNSLNITVIPLPCKTNDGALRPYLSHCAEKRPKILFFIDDAVFRNFYVYIGLSSNITMKGFDIIGEKQYNKTLWPITLYRNTNDTQITNPTIIFENMTIYYTIIHLGNYIYYSPSLTLNIILNDIKFIW